MLETDAQWKRMQPHLSIALGFIFLFGRLGSPAAMSLNEYFKTSEQLAVATAAAEGRTVDLEAMFAQGANVNFRGVDGMTPLYWAMIHQSKEGVSWLLDHGADPNAVFSRDGTCAVSLAAMSEDSWFIEKVLAHKGNPNFQNAMNHHTALMDAIVPVQAETGRALLAAGADPNTADFRGSTVLFNAIANQRYELAYEMLLAGADPTVKMGKRSRTVLWLLRRSQVPPGAPPYEWLLKIREFLRQKGLDVDHGE